MEIVLYFLRVAGTTFNAFSYSQSGIKLILLAYLVCLVICQSNDGYTDENRPYEFGFMIDGEQHRHEKKDEKGIIMGEFGFITADGIYHVTVYATDENGDFKILKMKNIKVGFPPGKVTTTTAKPAAKQVKLTGFMGCSGCLIPETSPSSGSKPGGALGNAVPLVQKYPNQQTQTKPTPFSSSQPKNHFGTNEHDKTPSFIGSYPKTDQKIQQQPAPFSSKLPYDTSAKTLPQTNNLGVIPNINNQGLVNSVKPATGGISPNTLSPKTNQEQLNTNKMIKLSEMEMRILDYMAKLYKFNYTLTFHGHEETGDVGGNKNGSYFTNGRDGYQRKVVYIANEFGYQPKISLVKLDSQSTPNKKNEKDLTELKGSEFIWFYKKK